MALVMNALSEEVTLLLRGNWFTFKPKQIKSMNDNLAHFIETDKKDTGLVCLPEAMEDVEFRESPEGKKILEEKRKLGIENRLRKAKEVIYNLEVSLRRDLETKNIKADPRVFASDGEIAAYELVAKYQTKKEDVEAEKLAKIEKLQEQIKAGS